MTTPMMQQWHACKEEAKEALLLFRLGDFYEAFYEDAKKLADELELTLTKRQDVPMAGIPIQALENYLEKLIAKDLIVAIAEQMEDPKATKGIVERKIVRIVTPATYISETQEKSSHYFASASLVGKSYGLALMDLSTGEFVAMEFSEECDLIDEIIKRAPKELLLSDKNDLADKNHFKVRLEKKPSWHFAVKGATETLLRHFKLPTLDGWGFKEKEGALSAAGALLSHVSERLSLNVSHIHFLKLLKPDRYMGIDRATYHHLELGALVKLMDKTGTAMGSRLLKKWILHPLLDRESIEKRQEAVTELKTLFDLKNLLKPIRDLERLIMRTVTGIATPRDLVGLKMSLDYLPALREQLSPLKSPLITKLRADLADATPITEPIRTTLVPEPPARLSDGGAVRAGVSKDLDELRAIKRDSHSFLASYQASLRESTGIKTLKVGYNRAFGYFIEVSRGQAEKMPSSFERRQTLVNNERFISPELKEYESRILGAEEKILALETQIFHDLREKVAGFKTMVSGIAHSIAHIDALNSLALLSMEAGYVKPHMTLSSEITIEAGRHPIIERELKSDTFIPNDTSLTEQESLFLITGPNMAGKSTYIRQVALIVIMAHIGSYVPAKAASIGLVDKVFSRIGASDDLARGQSTFMVEMTETANILNNCTDRSLVILDEIGRGTSTYDGISIAWSVAEYLLINKRPKTLFATHYFELTDLEGLIPGAVNYNVAVEECSSGILFLHKIVRGSTDRSYGIHVAKLAGLPQEVIMRAQNRLKQLEQTHRKESPQIELTFNEPKKESPLVSEIQNVDPNHLTPLQALELLVKWKNYV